MTDNPKPLPCPFCGSEDLIVLDRKWMTVACRDCWAEGSNADTELEAITAWNRAKR